MAVERLKKRAAMPGAYQAGLIHAAVIALLIMLTGQPQTPYASPSVLITDTDDPANAFADTTPNGPAWRETRAHLAPTPEGVGWMRWRLAPEDLQPNGPMALWLSGPFSAEVYFNGVPIGRKGEPAATRTAEKPGPIDATIAISPDAVRATGNHISIRYSSQRAGYQPATIFQALFITDYRADPRLDLMYHYAPTLLFTGALGAIAASLVLMGRARADARLYWLAFGVIGLLIALGTEVSRSVVNYPYNWHQPRQAVVSAGFVICAASLMVFVASRWAVSKRARFASIGAVAIAAMAAWVVQVGYDAKTTVSSMMFFSAAIVWTGWRGAKGETGALVFAAMAAGYPLLSLWSPGLFIDLSVYVLTVSMLGVLLLRAPDLLSPVREPAPPTTVLSIQTAGGVVFTPVGDIAMLKAAGNYTEVHSRNGEWSLDRRGISAVLADAPRSFMRIHRSYAVNPSAAKRLTSEEGSRYWLTLLNGERLPVSRTRVKDLRAAIGSSTDE